MKDTYILPDVQLGIDDRGIEISCVGVSEVNMPLRIIGDDNCQVLIPARYRLSVGLPKQLRAVHMSRLISLISAFSGKPAASLNLHPLLSETVAQMHSSKAEAEVKFENWFCREAPVSKLKAFNPYSCSLSASLERREGGEDLVHVLGLGIRTTTLCPCSKAISDNGAHNQRLDMKCRLKFSGEFDVGFDQIDEFIKKLETSASSPVYPILKRIDEKYVTEAQYNNPKFVEDVVRDAVSVMRSFQRLDGFSIEVEAYESLHAHNAWARYSERM